MSDKVDEDCLMLSRYVWLTEMYWNFFYNLILVLQISFWSIYHLFGVTILTIIHYREMFFQFPGVVQVLCFVFLFCNKRHPFLCLFFKGVVDLILFFVTNLMHFVWNFKVCIVLVCLAFLNAVSFSPCQMIIDVLILYLMVSMRHTFAFIRYIFHLVTFNVTLIIFGLLLTKYCLMWMTKAKI